MVARRTDYWSLPVLQKFSKDARILYIYLHTNHHIINDLGAYRCSVIHMVHDIYGPGAVYGPGADQTCSIIKKALSELCELNMIDYDSENELIILKTYQYPANKQLTANYVKYLIKHFRTLPDSPKLSDLSESVKAMAITYNVNYENLTSLKKNGTATPVEAADHWMEVNSGLVSYWHAKYNPSNPFTDTKDDVYQSAVAVAYALGITDLSDIKAMTPEIDKEVRIMWEKRSFSYNDNIRAHNDSLDYPDDESQSSDDYDNQRQIAREIADYLPARQRESMLEALDGKEMDANSSKNLSRGMKRLREVLDKSGISMDNLDEIKKNLRDKRKTRGEQLKAAVRKK